MSNVIEEIVNNNKCSGCLACVNICDKKAIFSTISKEGFYRPKIDFNLCINCSKCFYFCNEAKASSGFKTLEFIASQTKDDKTLLISTSGGFFQEIGNYFIKNGDVVYGSIYDSEMNIIISRATTVDVLQKMSGSKYAHSNASTSYAQVLNDLKNNKKVLFSGTPCQVSGLLTFLKYNNCDCNNLFTIDFPCYGITPIVFFKENIHFLNKEYDINIQDFRFRDKEKNGFSHTTVIKYNENGTIKKRVIDDYKRIPCHFAFGEANFFQSICYSCEFIKKERVSDFTIGSVWNNNIISDKFNKLMGVSMVCINTNKGERLFNKISNLFIVEKLKADDCYDSNHGLYIHKSALNRNKVFRFYMKNGFEKTAKKFYSSTGHFYKIDKFVYRILNRIKRGFCKNDRHKR